MGIEELAKQYLSSTRVATLVGLIGYIDANDKTIATIDELTQALSNIEAGQSLLPLESAAYEAAVKEHHALVVVGLEATGVATDRLGQALGNYAKVWK